MHTRDRPFYRLTAYTRFLVYFCVSAIGIYAAVASLDYQEFALQNAQLRAQETIRQSLAASALQSDLLEPIDDINTIVALQVIEEYANHPTKTNRHRVEREFQNFVLYARVYHHLTFLDASGMEKIRVNFDGNTATGVPLSQLKNMSGNAYFRDVIKLKPDTMYISPMDVLSETGQSVQNNKRVIRFAKPVYNVSGHLQGIIVLTYLAPIMLNDLQRYMEGSWGESMMVNASGVWLSRSREKIRQEEKLNKEVKTASGKAPAETFKNRYPQAWSYISSHNSGLVQTGNGLFIFNTVWPYEVSESRGTATEYKHITERDWKIITYVAPDVYTYKPLSIFSTRSSELFGLSLVIAILSAALAWLRTNYIANADALRKSEEHFRQLIEQASDGIFIANHQGRYTDVNTAGCNMLGYSRDEIVGRSIADFLPEKDIEYLGRERELLMHGDVNVREWLMRHKDGHYVPVEVSAKFLTGDRWQGIVRDISERKRIEQQLQEYREQLEEMVLQRTAALEASNKELEAFTYSIAHDLRAPLRAVTSFGQVLELDAGEKLNANEREDLQRIIKAGKYMARLVDDILELSRVGRWEFVKETVNLSKMATDIVAQLKPLYPQHNVKIDITPNMLCKGDMRLLNVALEHLLENALKFTAKQKNAHVEFGVMSIDSVPVYYVRDNGVGFDMTFSHKLFSPFGRLHSANEFEGAGIGLVAVQSAIQRHNGKVWAESKEGEGTTFYFSLQTIQPERVHQAALVTAD